MNSRKTKRFTVLRLNVHNEHHTWALLTVLKVRESSLLRGRIELHRS